MSDRASGRVGRLLRSRRLAVWLLGALAAWSVLGTLVPQEALEPLEVVRWAQEYPLLHGVTDLLGLHSAFNSPVFLGLVAVLLVSTVVCAWERTRAAVRAWKRHDQISRRDVESVLARPDVVLDLDGADAWESVSSALRALRLRVTAGPKVVLGRKGRWGLIGSPLFHWSLVALIVVLGAGRLTRAEGLMGVPEGSSVPDVAESYGLLDEALFFPGHPEQEIAVSDIQLDFMTGDVNRGAAPLVSLVRDGEVVAEDRVYPNNPLKHGWTMVHISEWGHSARVSLETTSGEPLGETTSLMDVMEGADRSTTAEIALLDEAGAEAITVEATFLLAGQEPTLELVAKGTADGATLAEGEVLVGEALTLPEGQSLVFEEYARYARLSVVHDWSVTPLYAMFVLALVGISIAVFSPNRRVIAVLDREGEGRHVAVRIRHGRGRSALFEDEVKAAFEREPGVRVLTDDETPTELARGMQDVGAEGRSAEGERDDD